ncbi:MAG: FHIPEP family type III secretion protein, partial [Phycisphaerales bacterium]
LGSELTSQLTAQPTGLMITSGFLCVLAFTPLPTLPLLVTGVGIGAVGSGLLRTARTTKQRAIEEEVTSAQPGAPEPPPIEDLLKVDVLELEVGYGLVPLIDTSQGGDLLDRISAVRRQLAVELGLVMPPVRIRDNMQLAPGEYNVKIRGNTVANGAIEPGRLLAMDSGLVTEQIDGVPTREPAFGLDAMWIDSQQRQRAEALNYTVVDPTSVLATHITELVKTYADELLTREEVNNLLEGLKEKAGKLVEETIPAVIKTGELQKILQSLLRERVPIRDMECVLETLADWGTKTKDLDVLVEYVRNGLRRTICAMYSTPDEEGNHRLLCVTLDPNLEDQINAYIDRGAQGTTMNMPARVAREIATQISNGLGQVTMAGGLPVVIASPQVRQAVWQIIEPHVPAVAVLGYNEIVPGIDVESLALIEPIGQQGGQRQQQGEMSAAAS